MSQSRAPLVAVLKEIIPAEIFTEKYISHMEEMDQELYIKNVKNSALRDALRECLQLDAHASCAHNAGFYTFKLNTNLLALETRLTQLSTTEKTALTDSIIQTFIAKSQSRAVKMCVKMKSLLPYGLDTNSEPATLLRTICFLANPDTLAAVFALNKKIETFNPIYEKYRKIHASTANNNILAALRIG